MGIYELILNLGLLGANSLTKHLAVKFCKCLELSNLILGVVGPTVDVLGIFKSIDPINPPVPGADLGSKPWSLVGNGKLSGH